MRLLAVVLGYTYPSPVMGQNLETQLFDIANKTTTLSDTSGGSPVSSSSSSNSSKGFSSSSSSTGRTKSVTRTPPTSPSTLLTSSSSSSSLNNKQQRIEFTPLAGRTFSVWTAVTCLVCLVTASDPDNKSLLKVTLGTFIIALLYFILELFVYKTVTLRTAIRPAIIACKYFTQKGKKRIFLSIVRKEYPKKDTSGFTT